MPGHCGRWVGGVLTKQTSRVRMLRYEENATKTLKAIIEFCAKIERDLKTDLSGNIRSINVTELNALLTSVPELCRASIVEAGKGKEISDIDARLAKIAPSISAASQSIPHVKTEADVRNNARSAISAAKKVIIDIDEVECPHCSGRGQKGLGGSLCSYCRGSCFVSNAEANAYAPDKLDEQDCPRCGGRGQTGFVGDLCSYCGGDGYVTEQEVEDYDPALLDEVECPHCNCHGQYGRNSTICAYCGGSCFVSKPVAKEYNRTQIDEVECPRCGGAGQTGRAWVTFAHIATVLV